MKNIPVKFRGVSELTGKTIYGVGVKDYGDNRVDIITGGMALEAVQADSVAQLAGYDVDGKEVYEGDIINRPDPTDEYYFSPTIAEVHALCTANYYIEWRKKASCYCLTAEQQIEHHNEFLNKFRLKEEQDG